MARRLPPLNALRAFEAGARHLSFTKAAEELHVTQAAVSHQVKALEDDLGLRLFRRMTRKLALTAEGRALLPVVSEAFDRIAETARALTAETGPKALTVSLTPSFGTRWLARRLSRFWREHSDIDLRLHHSIQVTDFARDEVDMAVRWGRGVWPGVESVYLMHAAITPVCSPALLEGPHAIRAPADLAHHALLHGEDFEEWAEWLTTAGVEVVNPRRGPIIDEASVLLQAAVDGQGVALVPVSLVSDELNAGRLVAPFGLALEMDFAYYVVAPPGAFEQPRVKAFRDFLLAEAAADRAQVGRAP